MTRTKLANQVHKVMKEIHPSTVRDILGVVVDIVALELIESGEGDPSKTQSAWAILGEAQKKAGKYRVKAGLGH